MLFLVSSRPHFTTSSSKLSTEVVWGLADWIIFVPALLGHPDFEIYLRHI
jgi:hypothetical protein